MSYIAAWVVLICVNLPLVQTLHLWLNKSRLGTQQQIKREGPRSFHCRNGTIVAAILGGVHYMYLYTRFDLVHRWSTTLATINSTPGWIGVSAQKI